VIDKREVYLSSHRKEPIATLTSVDDGYRCRSSERELPMPYLNKSNSTPSSFVVGNYNLFVLPGSSDNTISLAMDGTSL